MDLLNVNSFFELSKEDKGPISRDAIKQDKINQICSCLVKYRIRTSRDLLKNLKQIIIEGFQRHVFTQKSNTHQCYLVFQNAIHAYEKMIDSKITLNNKVVNIFHDLIQEYCNVKKRSPQEFDDLRYVTRSYDRLVASSKALHTTHESLLDVLDSTEVVKTSHLIIGAGDTGTTLWLEKYKNMHQKVKNDLKCNTIPDVLMVGESFGSWKHDYTLAQPESSLERINAKANPSDFTTRAHYRKNRRTNARHLYQANHINLAKTNAPLLQQTTVIAIEKKENHREDWKSEDHNYRVVLKTQKGEKIIYTKEIDIATGLGPARKTISERLSFEGNLNELNQFNPVLGYTPIVDGNQFILSDSEEKSAKGRTIVVYGGGGSAAACYRKGFFGTDVHTEDQPFIDELMKNHMFWIAAKGFDAAGTGKLATSALSSASERKELYNAVLKRIVHDPATQKLKLYFMPVDAHQDDIERLFVVEADQLVYSIGQEDFQLRTLCREFIEDLTLERDEAEMPLSVAKNDDIHLFGAAAMALKPQEYNKMTWDFLHAEHIGPDVGPGSMPPSRAQIKRFLNTRGYEINAVNVNIDSHLLIKKFLEKAHVPQETIDLFILDILKVREEGPSGCSHPTLQQLIDKYELNHLVKIAGHAHLVYAE